LVASATLSCKKLFENRKACHSIGTALLCFPYILPFVS
jgi:hypothetical protein